MSDLMRLIPYKQLLNWVIREYRGNGSIFGVSKIVKRKPEKFPIFSGGIETVFGPAAGPNTQLAQNLIASYCAGSSWFELKTVQKIDGRELAACVPKPCIASEDECYNCEWSTELEVGQAYEEYVKAWFIIHILATELNLGDPDGIVFNMSVGYDLEGIKTPKMQRFLNDMIEAKDNDVFRECVQDSLEAVHNGLLRNVTSADILAIPSSISSSVTESTLHGCLPKEIELIADYLLEEKHLNCYVKCNPTLLGYESARNILDSLGFDYIAFDDHHFTTDLQWKDAVPMFRRLMKLSSSLGLETGVKLTNTFPVDVKRGELPSEEMYMSGRSLYPLSMELASRISKQFEGKLRISYSGGADYFSMRDLVLAGIWPVTMATNLLKPGGYQRMSQIAASLEDIPAKKWEGIDAPRVGYLAQSALEGTRYRKSVKMIPVGKMDESLPLMDCFTSPCRSSCPIHQDIPAYLRAMEEGRSVEALKIILERNPLPFITGTICPHTCTNRCMRNYYEEGVHIRDVKLEAAHKAFKKIIETNVKRGNSAGTHNVAIVGGGPAGLSAALFLSRSGVPVTLFESSDELGGTVRSAVPRFRISSECIDKDIELCERFGAKFITGIKIKDLKALFRDSFTDVIVAVGATLPGRRTLKYGKELDALEFLTLVKKDESLVSLGENVVVIGGGNTAMDTARAAVRLNGVKKVNLVYRRTRRYMPSDEEEQIMALEDGVIFMELLAPVGLKDGQLECCVMRLGEADTDGRRKVVDTGQKRMVRADSVISAVGERVDVSLLRDAGVSLNEKGLPFLDENFETSVKGLYAIGDCSNGPATVVKAIANAQKAASSIAGISYDVFDDENGAGDISVYLEKKGVLSDELEERPDTRCLGCPTVCEVCTDVCPNRANIAINIPGYTKPQILHVDGMCNECGNCAVFCPYSGRPYRDKLTLYWYEDDFKNSENAGFLPIGGTKVMLRFQGKIEEIDAADKNSSLYEPLRRFILAVIRDYPYLLRQ